ncbi:MAG: ATP-dependent DNA ligase [Zymomonas sp.]|nr:MAG: ATP-dependent DNA ligase [Zymomonas sp.]
MTNRKTSNRVPRGELNRIRVASPDIPEDLHFYLCPACGERVDSRRLGDVFHHEEEGHGPIAEIVSDGLSFIEPLLATLAPSPPPGDEWSHEIKYDGYRTQLHIDHGEGRAFTKNGHDWSDHYRFLIEAGTQLPCESAIIDGEVIVQHDDGKCDFHGLRAAIRNDPVSLVLMAFDLLELDGQDLRRKPLERRRELLQKLVGPNLPSSPIQFSADVPDGAALFTVIDDMGMEGIISKKRSSRYVSGRSTNWLKVKCFVEEELVVIGTERGDGPAVALLAREVDGQLSYAGGAMITLGGRDRDLFWQATVELSEHEPAIPVANRKSASWLRPELRVWVRTLRGEEKLRHATLLSIAKLPEHLR